MSLTSDDKEVLMFCPAQLWAFSLTHKSWNLVSLSELQDVGTRDEPLTKLQMDGDKKKVLEDLVSTYLQNGSGNASPGRIQGPSQGFNILLSGNTGTGKTLAVGEFYSPIPA